MLRRAVSAVQCVLLEISTFSNLSFSLRWSGSSASIASTPPKRSIASAAAGCLRCFLQSAALRFLDLAGFRCPTLPPGEGLGVGGAS
jgi:hypothetical protein